jgi:hypothetical protein
MERGSTCVKGVTDFQCGEEDVIFDEGDEDASGAVPGNTRI